VVVSVSPKAVSTYEKFEEKILESFVELVQGIGPEIACQWCEVLKHVRMVQEKDPR
jgi:hypothetical protein